MITKIIGIDPDTKTSGFAMINVTDKQKPVVIDYRLFKMDTADTVHDKLPYNYNAWRGIFDYIKKINNNSNEHIDVFIEDQYYSKNIKTVKQLSHVRGGFFAMFSILPVFHTHPPIPPATWQSKVLGVKPHMKRDVRKRMSLSYANNILGLKDIKNNNISDAICIAMYGYRVMLMTNFDKMKGVVSK